MDDLKASKDVHLKSNSIHTLFNNMDVIEQNPCQMQILLMFPTMLMKISNPISNCYNLEILGKRNCELNFGLYAPLLGGKMRREYKHKAWGSCST
jgi:hypothetical protein